MILGLYTSLLHEVVLTSKLTRCNKARLVVLYTARRTGRFGGYSSAHNEREPNPWSITIYGGPPIGSHGSAAVLLLRAVLGGQAIETGCLFGSLSPLLSVQWQHAASYFLDQGDMSIVRIIIHGPCKPARMAVCRGVSKGRDQARCMGESDEATGGSNTCMDGDEFFMNCTA